MADSIETIVYDRLDTDGHLDDDAKLYVMAALDGTLDEVIQGGGRRRTDPAPRHARNPRRRLPAASIRRRIPRHRPSS